MTAEPLGWIGVIRLGLVQSALGSIVVLATTTLNRVMVVEFALPAILPAMLVGLHYAVQVSRPHMGFGSDAGGRRTPWIIGGMVVLAMGGIAAAVGTALMATHLWIGLALAVLGYLAIGAGVSATGTTLLVLLAKRTAEHRRAAAATIVWMMMIAGFAITATVAGYALEPYSPVRLIQVMSCVAIGALVLAIAAVWNVEGGGTPTSIRGGSTDGARQSSFREALAEVWSEPAARRFTIFIFISMLAYSGQELILDPFAGAIFAYTPGQSTRLAGLQHAGVFCGMVLVAVAASVGRGTPLASLRHWAVGGCVASALALLGLVAAGLGGQNWSLRVLVSILGVANGIFAIAAIGQMMSMTSKGHAGREGVRMGLWGAAQGIAFGVGGLFGALASDVAKLLLGAPSVAYASVFALEAALFLYSAWLAAQMQPAAKPADPHGDHDRRGWAQPAQLASLVGRQG